jgi:hypothetical protein
MEQYAFATAAFGFIADQLREPPRLALRRFPILGTRSLFLHFNLIVVFTEKPKSVRVEKLPCLRQNDG